MGRRLSLIAVLFGSLLAQAAPGCYAVRPGNAINGDGTSWAPATSLGAPGAMNALPPSASLADNAIYYVSGIDGGIMASYAFAKASTTVTIRAATIADHGQTCTSPLGGLGSWSDPYQIPTSWTCPVIAGPTSVTIDGQYGNYVLGGNTYTSYHGMAQPQKGTFGIKFIGVTNKDCVQIGTNSAASNNSTVRYTEYLGTNSNASCEDAYVIRSPSDSPTFEYNYAYQPGHGAFKIGTSAGTNYVTNATVQYNWIEDGTAGSCHVEAFKLGSTQNLVIRYNGIRNMKGTANIATPNSAMQTKISSISRRDNFVIVGGTFRTPYGAGTHVLITNVHGGATGFAGLFTICQNSNPAGLGYDATCPLNSSRTGFAYTQTGEDRRGSVSERSLAQGGPTEKVAIEDDLQAYGNYEFEDNGNNQAWDGPVSFLAGTYVTSFKYYNNTHAYNNQQAGNIGTGSGQSIVVSLDVRNNLWYGMSAVTANSAANGGTVNWSHNAYFKVGKVTDHDVNKQISGSNPFTSYPKTNDLRLARNTSIWRALSSPHDTDAFGFIRCSSRGAFEFNPAASR